MGEIKSSIEIAMEKTKGFSLSPEEKKQILMKELQRKAEVMVKRYCEDTLTLKDFEMELKKHPPETNNTFLSLVFKKLLDEIHLTRENQKILDAISLFKNEQISSSILDKITFLEKKYKKILEEGFQIIESSLWKKIKDLGIQGDAVIPAIVESRDWQEYLKEKEQEFKKELHQLEINLP